MSATLPPIHGSLYLDMSRLMHCPDIYPDTDIKKHCTFVNIPTSPSMTCRHALSLFNALEAMVRIQRMASRNAPIWRIKPRFSEISHYKTHSTTPCQAPLGYPLSCCHGNQITLIYSPLSVHYFKPLPKIYPFIPDPYLFQLFTLPLQQ